MKTILVFGGSFNPPTLAHESIITDCLKMPQFNEVWVLPSRDRLDKTIGVSQSDRLSMLHKIKKDNFNNNKRLKISTFEFELDSPTKTYKTVAALQLKYPKTDFWFAFGEDSYKNIASWEHGTHLKKTLKVILFKRESTGHSSTKVRQSIAQGKSIAGQVSTVVADFIKKWGLYFN
jgi:nicotinate-nucleotide adenylyltransferase